MGITRGHRGQADLEADGDSRPVAVISPGPGWALIDIGELWKYRELAYFLVLREIKGKYAQSVLGVGWAVIQPLLSMVVFSVIFGNLLDVDSEGVPYQIFSYTALVPWVFFSGGLTGAAGSLGQFKGMFTRVYFPRLIMPMTAVLSKLVDFVIAFILIFGLMAWFKITPTIWVLVLPVLVALMMLTAVGMGLWLTSLAIQYRDIRFGLSFGIQLMMYASPVVYSANVIPDRYELIYALNPMVGVIDGFRSALLGTGPMPWDLLAVGSVTAFVIALGGTFYFRRMEKVFADVA